MLRKALAVLAGLLIAAGAASAQTVVRSADDGSGNVLFKSDGGRWAFIRGNGAPTLVAFGSENVPEDTLYIDEDTGLVYYFSGGSWTVAAPPAAATVPFSGVTTGTNTVTLEMTGQVNISGPDATTNVEIGSTGTDANAGTGGTSIAIGNAVDNSGNAAGNIVIGSGATKGAGANSVVIGTNAVGGTSANQVVIGAAATATASAANNVVIGPGATVANGSGNNVVISGTAGAATTGGSNVVLGSQASAGALSNVFVVGGLTTPINNWYSGRGVTSATATTFTINGTGGSGADNAGAGIVIAAGKGTGTAAGGDVQIQRSPSIATGSTAQSLTDAFYVRSQKKALTAGVATAIARISVPQGVAGLTGWTGGTLFYTVVANDATDYEAHSGSIAFAFINEAGTEACNHVGTPTSADTSAGSLTVAVTGASNAADTCDLLLNAASGLTETTLAAFYSIVLNGPGTVTPQ